MEDNRDLELWTKYHNGDKSVRWELLNNFRGLISSTAKKQSNVRPYSVVEAELKDLALKSFDTYDPKKGTKLSTHLMNNFKKISRGNIENQHAIRVPENIHFQFKPLVEANTYLTDTLGREPTHQELSDFTGWSLPKVVDASSRLRKELVESKQTYEPGIYETDRTNQALYYTYSSLDTPGKYILEHTTGYGGKELIPDGTIKKQLNMTNYAYNKKKNDIISLFREAQDAANEE